MRTLLWWLLLVAIGAACLSACVLWYRSMMWGDASELHKAAFSHDFARVQEILRSAARVDIDATCRLPRDHRVDGGTALMIAAIRGDARIMQALLDSGARSDKSDRFGFQPIHHAAMSGCADCIRTLVSAAPDCVHARATGEATALMLAVQFESVEVVEVLLAAGADPTAAFSDGTPCLSLATKNRAMTEVIKRAIVEWQSVPK